MSELEHIKSSFERVAKALRLRPSVGHGTGVSRTRITNGLTCSVTEGPWKFIADMPENAGGHAAGPTPGVYGRAALGSCLAMGYMMRAATMGVPIKGVEVEVQADYDDGALYGTADVPPGYLEVRYTVTVESNAVETDIMRVLDEADEHSPYLDVFRRAQPCRRSARIVPPKQD